MSFNPNKARQSFGGGSKPTGGFKVPDERGDGFDYDTFSVFVENNEGRRRSVYKDSEGIPTIGVGFNLTRHDAKQRIEEVGGDYQAVLDGKQDLSDDQVNQLLQPDLRTAVSDARSLMPKFDELSSERQRALADMSFNMGRERLGGFVNMLGAIEDGDWDAVQREAKDSKWFSQVGNRGPRVVELLGQGGPQTIEIARQDEELLPGKFDPQKARSGLASRLAQQQLNTVRDVDPQVASEAAALSKASGVSSHELTRNPELRDRLKTRLKSAVEQEALASSPATGRMLARSDFAAQAHDDVAALTQVEASAQSLQTEQDRAIGLRQTLGNALRRGGLRIAAGVNQAFGEDEAEEAGDVGRTFGEILEDEMTWGTTKDGKVVKSWARSSSRGYPARTTSLMPSRVTSKARRRRARKHWLTPRSAWRRSAN
jgi:GH24 family phage-related lysozyme (muramidase)